MRLRHKVIFLLALALAAPAGAQEQKPDLPRMRAAQKPAPSYGVPASAGQPAASSLVLGHCALGAPSECLKVLRCGLRPEDRDSVRLSGAEITVDAGHLSTSVNFKALIKIAGAADRTRLLVLAPAESFSVREETVFPYEQPALLTGPMGHPDTNDGFLGYTLFPYLGVAEEGIIYSPGPYSDAVINSKELPAELTATIFHELQHVILGDFGRSALLAKHGLPAVESAVNAAEQEAKVNAAQCP